MNSMMPVPQLPPDFTTTPKAADTEKSFQTGNLSDYFAILAAVALAVAIWGTVLGCRVTCCRRPITRVCRHVLLLIARLFFRFMPAYQLVFYGGPPPPPSSSSSSSSSRTSYQKPDAVTVTVSYRPDNHSPHSTPSASFL